VRARGAISEGKIDRVHGKVAARRFLDQVAMPNLSTVHCNDNIIVSQRMLTFRRDSNFMRNLFRASKTGTGAFNERTWPAQSTWLLDAPMNPGVLAGQQNSPKTVPAV